MYGLSVVIGYFFSASSVNTTVNATSGLDLASWIETNKASITSPVALTISANNVDITGIKFKKTKKYKINI